MSLSVCIYIYIYEYMNNQLVSYFSNLLFGHWSFQWTWYKLVVRYYKCETLGSPSDWPSGGGWLIGVQLGGLLIPVVCYLGQSHDHNTGRHARGCTATSHNIEQTLKLWFFVRTLRPEFDAMLSNITLTSRCLIIPPLLWWASPLWRKSLRAHLTSYFSHERTRPRSYPKVWSLPSFTTIGRKITNRRMVTG